MKNQILMLALLLSVVACKNNGSEKQSTETQTQATGTISMDGSSTVFPLSEALAEEFRMSNKGVDVTVGESGTGGGFKKFSRGELDIANASRPIKSAEDSACRANGVEYIELAICYDGLAVVVNPQNSFLTNITVAELKKMWEPAAQNKVKMWSDVNAAWPNEEIHLFGAGTQSGTYDYFTEAINGKSKASRGDYTASEDDNVLVQGISTDKLALGYFGLAYYESNKEKLKLLGIDNGNGTAVKPSIESVQNGSYQPLSRPLFVYINTKSLSNTQVNSFVDFMLTNCSKLAAEVGYVPLPAAAIEKVKQKFTSRVKGSNLIGKNSVGLTIDAIVQ